MSADPIDPRDDLLDRAARAVRDESVPPGPTMLAVERTRQAIRFAVSRGDGRVPVGLRWAAAALLAACVGAAVVATRALTGGRTQNTSVAGGGNPAPPAAGGVDPLAVANPPPLLGRVALDGPAPARRPLGGPAAVPGLGQAFCGHPHAPLRDDSILAGPGGGLANVVVCVSAGLAADRSYDPPAVPAILDQKDCTYLPRVVTMQVGQTLVATNSDPFFHSVHTNSRVNRPVNVAQPQPDPVGVKLKAIASPETFKVTCDLHPWMVAWVAAFDHPYSAVTAPDGSFHLPPLEPGTYTVRAWHERLGAVEQRVTVGPDWSCPPIVLTFGQDRLAAALADREPRADAVAAMRISCCDDAAQ